ATSNSGNSVQYRDTGKILTLLPQVNSKGLVNRQIRQDVSDVGVAAFGNTNSPSFTTRETETTAGVQDAETVIIGGIIDDTVRHVRSGIPYLMDIPFLGRAFRQENDTTMRTELIVLISPYVIRGRDEARDVSDEFASRIAGLKRLSESVRERHQRFVGERRRQRAEGTLEKVPTQPEPLAAPTP